MAKSATGKMAKSRVPRQLKNPIRTKYTVPSGTLILVRRAGATLWSPETTIEDQEFFACVSFNAFDSSYTFVTPNGLLWRVQAKKVIVQRPPDRILDGKQLAAGEKVDR